CRIAVELDQGAVLTAHALGRTHDNRVVNFALFHATTRRSNLDRDLDHITDACIATFGAAQHLDAQDFTSARVVGYFEPAFSLNHSVFFPNLIRQHTTHLRSVLVPAVHQERTDGVDDC